VSQYVTIKYRYQDSHQHYHPISGRQFISVV
jgi:hypothetical protein